MTNGSNNHKKNGSPFIFNWVLPLFLKPKKTTAEIAGQEKNVWLTPLLIVSALVILAVLISAPVVREAIQMGATLPPNFEYYSQDQQQQYYEAQATQTSPLFLYVFPLLGGLLKLWISWFLLSILLYLAYTLFGSRASSLKSYNLVAWSFLPIALRYLVQILAVLFTRAQISNPGLAGFVSADATGLAAFFRAILGQIDIYFIFQIVLLFLGSVALSGLAKTKAWIATAIAVFIIVLLRAIPGVISAALSDLSFTSMFYF